MSEQSKSTAGEVSTGPAAERADRRVLTGVVTSSKMNKTITVLVERTYRHPKYGKYVRKQKKYHAHDEREEAGVGDVVELVSTRPLSKLKRWRLTRIVEAAPERGVDVAAIAAAAEADVGLGLKPDAQEDPADGEAPAASPRKSKAKGQARDQARDQGGDA
jgi:small subunit ribosomal protein S17